MRKRVLRIVAPLLLACAPLAAHADALELPDDPARVEAFFDGLLPALLRSHNAPGATLSVVRGGEVLLEKGYGYADVAKRTPVDPQTSVFRLASVSKLVTTTAAMQLVSAGKLDLHADVNDVLEGFQLPAAYGAPVTLHNLLTHTGGFDDRFLRSSFPLGGEHPSLGDYLAERMPPRVMPPGFIISYSNHGLALVGHLVEVASGESFEDYVQQHVFDPLGMSHSSFGLPFPISDEIAVGHYWDGGKHQDIGYDYTILGPAAELASTAHDMARFMIAHLQSGRLGDARILDEDTAAVMQAQHFTSDPRLPGWCYGFQEGRLNEVRTIGHGGSWRGFRTSLILEPDSGVGVFLSVNSELPGGFWDAYITALADFAAPAPDPPKLTPPVDFDASRYTGDYIPNRRMRATILKLALFLQGAQVTSAGDGTITIDWGGGDPLHFVQIDRDFFREVDGRRHLAILTDDDDRIVHATMGGFALDRITALESPRVHALLSIAGVALFITTLLGWTWGSISRRLFDGGPSPVSRTGRAVAAAVCLLYTIGLLGTAASLSELAFFDLLIDLALSMKLLLLGVLLAAVLTLTLPFFAVRGIEGSGRAVRPARIHYWMLTVFAFVFVWISWFWNLLGFNY